MKATIWLAMSSIAVLSCTSSDDSTLTAPTIEGASISTQEDTQVEVPVLATAGTRQTVKYVIGVPEHGTVTGTAPMLTYIPNPNYFGRDSFRITVSDARGEASALFSLAVTPVNDPPTAQPDTLATAEDKPLRFATGGLLQNDSDVDGDSLTVTAVANPTHGKVELRDGMILFKPDCDFEGDASFEYVISDGKVDATAVVTVSVGGENDAPVAVADVLTTAEDVLRLVSAAELLNNDSDPDNQTVMITAVSDATNGTVSFDGTTISFMPAANFVGVASFRYTVTDGAATNVAEVTVNVTPVNDAPVGGRDAISIDEDTGIAIPELTLLENDADIEGQPLRITGVSNAFGGTVSQNFGLVSFVPEPNFVGTASFSYTVSDGELSSEVAVAVTVRPVNDAPVAQPDSVGGTEDTTLEIPASQLLVNDADLEGDTLTLVAVSNANMER